MKVHSVFRYVDIGLDFLLVKRLNGVGYVCLRKCHSEDVFPEISTVCLANLCCHFAIVSAHLLLASTPQILLMKID